ncbi:BTB/POZ protein [Rhizophagus clarus]|uniref:BTB/POZ protein n=1 Tax=Rhizophagus clarus TaxID=94130 RepID=A0A8H3QHI4_9GLOM|nr:BTB/POZ protein [Rhizophagus clarus]
MMSAETLLDSLLRDLNRLYKDANDYDVIIQVGEELNTEDFKAHSNILKIRSSYFDTALSSNWAKKEGNIYTFNKPNVSPNIFRIILKYIYTGTINIESVTVENNLIGILIAADEIYLEELVDYIQNHITTLDVQWFKRNEIKLYNTLSRYQGVFSILYEHFENLISNNPNIFLNNYNLFSELENDALLSLIQSDSFKMDEIEIWDNLIKWAITKNPTVNNDTSLWKINEFDTIRETIQQFIPHIRFFQISSNDYYYKIRPLSALLPKELNEELILHYLVPGSSLNTNVLPSRKVIIESKIIDMDHIYQIVHWIDKNQGNVFLKIVPYEFKLLLRGSRDGFGVKPFGKKCYNKGATLILIKLVDEDKIIGGYSPLSWRGASKYLSTNDSFIFSFKSTLFPSTTILSRVKNGKNAIYDSAFQSHGFGDGDLRIFDKVCIPKEYENRIIKEESFEIEDYEVFQIVKKKKVLRNY